MVKKKKKAFSLRFIARQKYPQSPLLFNIVQGKYQFNKTSFFTYNDNEQSANKIKETNPITIKSKLIKYLGINQRYNVFYTENYKVLMKEIKVDTNKWKDITCS